MTFFLFLANFIDIFTTHIQETQHTDKKHNTQTKKLQPYTLKTHNLYTTKDYKVTSYNVYV